MQSTAIWVSSAQQQRTLVPIRLWSLPVTMLPANAVSKRVLSTSKASLVENAVEFISILDADC